LTFPSDALPAKHVSIGPFVKFARLTKLAFSQRASRFVVKPDELHLEHRSTSSSRTFTCRGLAALCEPSYPRMSSDCQNRAEPAWRARGVVAQIVSNPPCHQSGSLWPTTMVFGRPEPGLNRIRNARTGSRVALQARL